jgi:general secretion pathway protein K
VRSHPASAAERGIILIAVLLAVAIMAVMVVATAALTRAGIGNEELEQRRLVSHLAIRSGVEAAKALILATPEDRRMYLDGDETVVDLGGGVSATVRLRDAAGFVDLNRSDPKLIEAVARFSGLGRDAADGLADRITQLRKEAAPEPAGTPPQKAPASPGAAPGAPPVAASGAPVGGGASKPPVVPIIFLAVDQLPGMLDIPAEEAVALGAGLTVYNPTGEINPLAAPEQVLQAIPGLSERDISDIAMARKTAIGANDSRLQQLTQRLPGMLTLRQPSVFVVDVKLDAGPGVLPGSSAQAVVRLMPQGQMPFGTLALEEK